MVLVSPMNQTTHSLSLIINSHVTRGAMSWLVWKHNIIILYYIILYYIILYYIILYYIILYYIILPDTLVNERYQQLTKYTEYGIYSFFDMIRSVIQMSFKCTVRNAVPLVYT